MKNKTAVLVATWFGSGLFPSLSSGAEMGGTYGSIAALPLCWWLVRFCWSEPIVGSVIYVAVIVLVARLGLWSVPIAEKELGPRKDERGKVRTRDQNQIVIDEVLGMLISCSVITVHPYAYTAHSLAAFTVVLILFRVFDIIKIWPANKLHELQSAQGVLLDDVAAGMWTAFVSWMAIFSVT
jgi:phosphatidylglycerophosphatase A